MAPKKVHPKDVVVLNQFHRARSLLGLSPYAIKIELFMRIAKIPYEVDDSNPYGGPKGKVPWINYNGMLMGDSTLIMAYLNKEFKIDLNADLTEEQKANSTAYKVMVEEHLYPCIGVIRFVREPTRKVYEEIPLPARGVPVVGSIVKCLGIWKYNKQLTNVFYIQGIGRHSDDEIYQLGTADLKALSELLGDKDYFFGGKPAELDCAVFGILCQLVWGAPGSRWPDIVKNDFPSLQNYTMRLKEEYFTDWDQLLWKP